MKLVLLLASIVTVFSNVALAQNPPGVESMRSGKGMCRILRIGTLRSSCDGFVYAHFRNGRTAWNLSTPNGAVMLSGRKDSQPSPERYRLYIDRVRINNPGSQPIELNVSGMCETILSTDGGFMRSLECSARGDENVAVEFVSDGRRVIR